MNECHSMRHFRINDVEVSVYRAKTLGLYTVHHITPRPISSTSACVLSHATGTVTHCRIATAR